MTGFYVAFLTMAVGGSLAGFLSITTAIVNWFDRKRSLAMGIALLGTAVGGFLLPLVVLALEHWGVKPDLITFAKGSNSGYVPVGGVIISDPIARTFDDRVFPGGLTYSGHPLAAASIVATIDVMLLCSRAGTSTSS